MTIHAKVSNSDIAQSKVTRVGSSTGIVLPKGVLEALGVTKGEAVTFRKTADGVEMVKFDRDYEHDIAIARHVMKKYHNTFKELAK